MNYKFSSFFTFLVLVFGQMTSCTAQNSGSDKVSESSCTAIEPFKTGAERTDIYLDYLSGKRVAMLINQTSVVTDGQGNLIPLVDTLINLDVDIKFLMAPEHGLKGLVSAGDEIADSRYQKKKNIEVYSLYGKNKKPQSEWLNQVDCVLFDIQDVGCRFYTYLSTLYYLLEACGECDKEVIILDRPNPNDTIDGPVLDLQFQSFVGMVQVPLLHGCTLGELAQMMIGEGWIKKPDGTAASPKVQVITCKGWQHGDDYSLPIAPSPNLRTDHAIRMYPSLCLFEATDISIGRGTDWPFEVLGHPLLKGDFSFVPQHCEAASHPLQEGKTCNGYDLRQTATDKGFHLEWLLDCHSQLNKSGQATSWIKQNTFFDRLAGTDQLRNQIAQGLSEDLIRESWQEALTQYKQMRQKHLLYQEQ